MSNFNTDHKITSQSESYISGPSGKQPQSDTPPPPPSSSTHHHDIQTTQKFHNPSQHQQHVIGEQPDVITMKYSKVYEVKPEGFYQKYQTSVGKISGWLRTYIPCCCCCDTPYQNVSQGYVGLITRFGELSRVVDPGSVYINRVTEKIHTISIKTEVQDVPEQACLTRDNVIVNLKSVIYYNVVDPQKAVFGISNIHDAISERTQTTLRDVIGSKLLQEVIEQREQIAESIQDIIKTTAFDWGVRVESILIKDLKLGREISDSLSQAAQSKRVGEAKIIAAKAEVESAKLMRQAADILASKPAMQIRYLDAMQNMAKSANSKVIFMPSSGDIGEGIPDAKESQEKTRKAVLNDIVDDNDNDLDDSKHVTNERRSNPVEFLGPDDIVKQTVLQASVGNA
ncbi:hypothetical protein WICMUC_003002 [Wickerhamomyces mucosus]|uniref:Band 7 domain-containing protein n=1 Tax=Wickerhamomyces mucosus TaxID=1378264 RepID=A0A9P8PNV0_9ASCO|nr:hypothetical protein WICMUC_003002 [Wickerhamomyces mucosus]